jgi:hypothetical protein
VCAEGEKLMTVRGLSVWVAVAGGLLAILVAVERPHWFGLEAAASGIDGRSSRIATGETGRTAPWKIDRQRSLEH